jgi:hypothetical protein
MKDKGITVMVGLLGEKPKMGGKEEGGLLSEDNSSCPLATQDVDINKGNQKKAILTANYGSKKDGEGKCKACEYFKTDLDCGIPKDMGYCEIFDFTCSKENGCDAWEAMGKEETEEMED